MRYSVVRKMDVSNGPGLRVSIFVQGCEFKCKNCFNSETWDFDKGKDYTDKTIETVLDLCEDEHISGLSILGGEPMHKVNIDGVTKLAKKFKERFPDKTIWAWSGFLYEYVKTKDIINYLDVLVDGQYVDSLHDFRLKYRGSSNQRVINVKESLKKNKIVIIED